MRGKELSGRRRQGRGKEVGREKEKNRQGHRDSVPEQCNRREEEEVAKSTLLKTSQGVSHGIQTLTLPSGASLTKTQQFRIGQRTDLQSDQNIKTK